MRSCFVRVGVSHSQRLTLRRGKIAFQNVAFEGDHRLILPSLLNHTRSRSSAARTRQQSTLASSAVAAASSSTTKPMESRSEIDFMNAKDAFSSKSLFDLTLGWMIFKACSVKVIVDKSEVLYQFALRTLGGTLVHAVVKRSFFAHFCAGEDTEGIKPRIDALRSMGIGSILDYAAEAELESSKPQAESLPIHNKQRTTARVYEYSSEAESDRNAAVFEQAVRAVKDTSPEGFAAVKVSALGDTRLLERISSSLVELRRFFLRVKTLDSDASNVADNSHDLTFDEFRRGWEHFFHEQDEAKVRAVFDRVGSNGKIDFLEWTYALSLEELSSLVVSCRSEGPLSRAALNDEELELLANLRQRLHGICKLSKDLGVRVMIDAEWVAIQPVIDHLAISMQREFNQDGPIVFNTYQTYLRGAFDECKTDIARSRREGWAFGAKLVRGAYMVSERERAEELGIPSPVWDTYEESEESFHRVIREVMGYVHDGVHNGAPGAEVMVATHNRHSCKLVVEMMQDLNLPPNAGVYFGQLLGMADHITMTLGQNGYKAYKYVPYGPVDKVMPYLIRRTQENSTFLGSPGVQEERRLLSGELRRRLTEARF